MTVTRPSSLDAETTALAHAAWDSLEAVRGGRALKADLLSEAGESSLKGALASYVAHARLLVVHDDDGIIAAAVTSAHPPVEILGVYVTPDRRRQGVGRELVQYARHELGAVDGWALPGDRATKSLYESIRWKARRLTMSGGTEPEESAGRA